MSGIICRECGIEQCGKHELLDSTPIAIPLKFRGHQGDNLRELVQSMVHEVSNNMGKMGFETFEEAEDFQVDDDYDPKSPWEADFDPGINVAAEAKKIALRKAQEAKARKLEAQRRNKEDYEEELPQETRLKADRYQEEEEYEEPVRNPSRRRPKAALRRKRAVQDDYEEEE